MPIIEGNVSKFVVFATDEPGPYYDFNSNSTVFVPSAYVATEQEQWRYIDYEEGITNEELLRYAEGSKAFEFLKEPGEDIYGLNDGERV